MKHPDQSQSREIKVKQSRGIFESICEITDRVTYETLPRIHLIIADTIMTGFGLNDVTGFKAKDNVDFNPTSHAKCLKDLGVTIKDLQSEVARLIDQLSEKEADKLLLLDDIKDLIESKAKLVTASTSLAIGTSKIIKSLKQELVDLKKDIVDFKLMNAPNDAVNIKGALTILDSKLSKFTAVEDELALAVSDNQTLTVRNQTLTECVTKLAAVNRTQQSKISDLENQLRSTGVSL